MTLKISHISILFVILALFVGYISLQFNKDPESKTPVIQTNNDIEGKFEGRMPCGEILLAINNILANGCERVKISLVFSKDKTFQINMIYVGKGDTKYSSTGTWISTQGAKANLNTTVYKLIFDEAKPELSFFQADDNVLLLLNEDMNLMVGNAAESYTLNRVKP